jgi:hypothetical protein
MLSGGSPEMALLHGQHARLANNQLIWSKFRPMFQAEFAGQSKAKLIIKGLSNITMKINQDTRDLINQIIGTMVIIKESYANYHTKCKSRITT